MLSIDSNAPFTVIDHACSDPIPGGSGNCPFLSRFYYGRSVTACFAVRKLPQLPVDDKPLDEEDQRTEHTTAGGTLKSPTLESPRSKATEETFTDESSLCSDDDIHNDSTNEDDNDGDNNDEGDELESTSARPSHRRRETLYFCLAHVLFSLWMKLKAVSQKTIIKFSGTDELDNKESQSEEVDSVVHQEKDKLEETSGERSTTPGNWSNKEKLHEQQDFKRREQDFYVALQEADRAFDEKRRQRFLKEEAEEERPRDGTYFLDYAKDHEEAYASVVNDMWILEENEAYMEMMRKEDERYETRRTRRLQKERLQECLKELTATISKS